MERVFLYSVCPKKVIKELPTTIPIRSPKSLYLTKEQVKICLKYGSVYRRFANEQRNERVTIMNIDRLHNEKFMTEEQYKEYEQSLKDGQRGSVIVKEPKVEDPTPEVKEDKVEEKVEVVVEEEKVETVVTEDPVVEEEKVEDYGIIRPTEESETPESIAAEEVVDKVEDPTPVETSEEVVETKVYSTAQEESEKVENSTPVATTKPAVKHASKHRK